MIHDKTDVFWELLFSITHNSIYVNCLTKPVQKVALKILKFSKL